MTQTTLELAQARQTISSVLEELKLEAYLFEVEPREGQWELKVECAIDDGWSTVTLQIAEELLVSQSEDSKRHEMLLEQCCEALVACKKKKGSSPNQVGRLA